MKAPWPHFDVQIADSDVVIKTQGIERIMVNLGENGLRMNGKVKLTINDKVVFEGNANSELMTFN
jgi:hypothetical protein